MVLALSAESLVACGSPPANTLLIDNSLNVTIYTDGKRGQGPPAIDLDDPRVGKAQSKIAQLLGHPLGFEFDAALAAKFGDDLHRAYVSALEESATALVSCKKHEPEAFAYGSEVLQEVRLAYSPMAAGQMTEPALEGSTLPIAVRLDSSRLIEGYEFCSAFQRGFKGGTGRFDTVDPADVASKDEAAYLEYLKQRHGARQGGQEEQLDELKRGMRILAFQPHIEQREVRDEANRLLGYFGSTLHELMASQPSDVVLLTALGKAHPAWIAWVNANGATLPASERLTLSGKLMMKRDPISAEFTVGFDAPRFGQPTLEHWLETVSADEPRNTRDQLERCIVAPVQEGDVPPQLWVDSNCRGAVYSDLARTPKGIQQLVTLLLRWRNDVLTESAMLHTLRDQGAPAALALLEALARDQKVSRVALRALAEYNEWRHEAQSKQGSDAADPRPLVASVPGWWKSHPEHRPTLLYMLVRIGEHREGLIVWPKLAQFLGSRIDARELAGFLAEDPRNIWYVPELASAFSPGWSRSRVLLPGLQAYLDAEAQNRIRYGITQNLERVTAALCQSGTRQDLDAVQDAMRERAVQYPSQSRLLNPFVNTSPATLCPKLAAAKARKPTEGVLFGD